MQLIYTGKTKRCLSRNFQVTITENHQTNQIKAVERFEFTSPYSRKVKVQNGYLKEQTLQVTKGSFKGQDKNELKELCAENSSEIVIVSHNLRNKSQPLDISVNKSTIFCICEVRFDVSKQLKAGKSAAEMNVSLQLAVIKPLHACKVNCRSK